MSSRWRGENYFRRARTRSPSTPIHKPRTTRSEYCPARRRQPPPPACGAAVQAVAAAQADGDAAAVCAAPAHGHSVILTNQALNARVEADWRELANADAAAVATPARGRSAIWPRIWSGWTPRSSRSPTPSGWPPATPRPFCPRPPKPLRPRPRRARRAHPRIPHHLGRHPTPTLASC
jgi:hypothetical protein